MMNARLKVHLTALPLVALLFAGGCGSDPMASVSGQVKYTDGSPIEGGVRELRFEPTDDSPAEVRKPALGLIDADGSFEMFTRKPGDGVFKGKYGVAFTVMTKPMGGESLIKEEYTQTATSPYTVEVDGDISDLVFEIEPK